jgi:hypothetical protein
MTKGSSLRQRATDRVTRTLRTARALADMASQLLDWERSHRALLAAVSDDARPAPRTAATRARLSTPAEVEDVTAPPAIGAVPTDTARFQDTLAKSHAPHRATLHPEAEWVGYAPPARDGEAREDDAHRSH